MTSIPSDTRVSPSALSWWAPGRGRDAVLLVHGYTGVVEEMRYLGDRLCEAGFGVSIPRLPGHGTNHQDLLSVSWRDWYRRCFDEYLDLASSYDRVFVAGLSMGGLLALLLAAQLRVPRIALAAPALLATRSAIRIAPLAQYVVRYVGRASSGSIDEPDPERRRLAAEYRERHWIGAVAQLRLLQRVTLSRLPGVTAATLTIVSEADRAVPTRVVDLVESRIRSVEKRHIVLERSGHVVVDDIEREWVADEIVEWFRR